VANEDFTTYTEVDPNSRLTVTADTITSSGLTRNEDAYAYDDKGVNFFDGDFTHSFEHRHDSASDIANFTGVWMLSNIIDDVKGIATASGDALVILTRNDPINGLTLFLREYNGGVSTQDSTGAIIGGRLDETLYYEVSRDESIGTFGELKLEIYTDSTKSTLLDTLTVTLTQKQDFRYVFPIVSWNDGFTNKFDGTVSNLNLDPISSIKTPLPILKNRILQ
jgi:hypothetical protein